MRWWLCTAGDRCVAGSDCNSNSNCAELRVTERCGQLRVRMEWEIEWLAVQYCGWHTTSWLQAATKYDTGIWIDLNVLSNEVGWFVLIFRLFYWEMAIYVFCLCVDSLWLWTYMAMDSMLRLLWTNLAEVFAWSSPWMLHSWLLFFPGRLWSGFFNEDHADTLYFQLLFFVVIWCLTRSLDKKKGEYCDGR